MVPGTDKLDVSCRAPPPYLCSDSSGKASSEESPIKIDDSLVTGIEDVDVGRCVVTEVHSDGDPIKGADLGHRANV